MLLQIPCLVGIDFAVLWFHRDPDEAFMVLVK